jgi:AcrR family transcriptional regulator
MDNDDRLVANVRRQRADGVQARERILAAALRLFVARGYGATSVRAIAQAAGVNVAAIAYYFDDKPGLYRAALHEPLRHEDGGGPAFDQAGLALPAALKHFLLATLRPLGQGEAALLSVRLRLRETFEPTGMLNEERARRDDMQARLGLVLARELGMAAPDAGVRALGFSIWALVIYPYIGHEQIRRAAPVLFDAPDAHAAWIARLGDYACAMVAAERERRAQDPIPRQPTESPT